MSKAQTRFLTYDGQTMPFKAWLLKFPFLSLHSMNTRYNRRLKGEDMTDAQVLFGSSGCPPKKYRDTISISPALIALYHKFHLEIMSVAAPASNRYYLGHDVVVMPYNKALGELGLSTAEIMSSTLWVEDKSYVFELLELVVDDHDTLYLSYYEKTQLLRADV